MLVRRGGALKTLCVLRPALALCDRRGSPPALRVYRGARSLRSNPFTSVMIFAYARVDAANPVGGT